MKGYEEMFNNLPSDEDLEKKEKNGSFAKWNNDMSDLQTQLDKFKEENRKEDEELERMLRELDEGYDIKPRSLNK